jgi:type IV secretory pathway ATPase VirB11/archaellum biosynthesis ATPase
MMPGWIVVGELVRREGPAFFEALASGCSGLATVQTPEPEVAFGDWLSMGRMTAGHLEKDQSFGAPPMQDQRGRPRIQKMIE